MELTKELTKELGSLCDICHSKTYKYKCPGCDRRSCSVSCVKKHKTQFDCSGMRCKTAYVKMADFDDNHLLSDYYFLEDVSRCVDSAHRVRIHSDSEHLESRSTQQQFHWLKVHARRRSTTLLSHAPGMTKHKNNTSRTLRSNNKWAIQWMVQLVFQSVNEVLTEHNVPEDMKLLDLLEKFIHPTNSDPIIRHKLRLYVQAEGVQVFLKNEMTSSSSNDELDLDKSICDNLRNKTVVEFPTLIITTREDLTKPLNDCSVTPPPCLEEPGGSDWSDYEEGEMSPQLSSLGLIAEQYGDS